MNSTLASAIGRALEQTRAANPAEATRIIQAALAGRDAPDHPGRPRCPDDAFHFYCLSRSNR
jgi:hypothetical protein